MSRPITIGTGVRVSAYIPLALWERLDDRLNHLDGVPISNIVQEAIARYLDDMDDVDRMDAHYTQKERALYEAKSATEGV